MTVAVCVSLFSFLSNDARRVDHQCDGEDH